MAYESLNIDESLELRSKGSCEAHHAAHLMLYAKWPGKLFGRYPFKYAVMMQMRFDGALGFPGGEVDEGESPEEAVSREFQEEMGSPVSIQRQDHINTTYSTRTKFCLHFYAKEVTMEQFRQMEHGCTRAKEWGDEVMGMVRCPLYTLPNGLGLPGFLRHTFIGTAQSQLLTAMKERGLLTGEEVDAALKCSKTVDPLVRKADVDY